MRHALQWIDIRIEKQIKAIRIITGKETGKFSTEEEMVSVNVNKSIITNIKQGTNNLQYPRNQLLKYFLTIIEATIIAANNNDASFI
jgi:hypothetical protein